MKHLSIVSAALVASAVLTPTAAAQFARPDRVIVPTTTSQGSGFGRAIDVDGDRMLVGAPNENYGALSSGVSYVFERDAIGAWQQVQQLTPNVGGFLLQVGHAVDLDGDRLVMSSRNGAGFVLVFERDTNGTWVEVATVLCPVFDQIGFGAGVALDGDRLVVCSQQNIFFGHGRLFVFERNVSGTWVHVATATTAVNSNVIGPALVLEGDRCAVGAPNAFGPPAAAGAVVVFERQSNGTWIEVAVAKAATPEASAYLGTSLDLSGDRLVAGAPSFAAPNPPSPGAVHVFERQSNGQWLEVEVVQAATPELGALFGSSIALEGEQLVVVSERSSIAASGAGAVHVFELGAAGQFEERAVLVRGDPQQNDYSGSGAGRSLVVADGRAYVGAPFVSATPLGGVVDEYDLRGLLHGDSELSLSAGGSQDLLLRGPLSTAGDIYFVLGSASGTTPGIPLAPGVDLPLVFDAYTNLALSLAIPVAGQFGVLDASGSANAAFNVPAGASASFAGLVLHHAYVAIDLTTFDVFASNAARVELVP